LTKILVVNGSNYGQALEGLGELVTNVIDFIENPTTYRLILFTGGEDITPGLYNDISPTGMCFSNLYRDNEEREIFELAIKHNIRMIGICRGVQFLNVMAGGKMFHDVDNHAGSWHDMTTSSGEIIRVNSLHHQMVIPPKDAEIIGWSSKHQATKYYGDKDLLVDKPKVEPEAVLFKSINAAGVQYHPEIMDTNSTGYRFFYKLAEDLLNIDNFSDISNKYMEKSCHLTTQME